MKNPLRKLPTKPGRTAPSSRVKKKKKSGQAGFIGPRKFEDELAEDKTARHRDRMEKFVLDETDEPIPLSRSVQKSITKAVGDRRYLDDGSSAQQALRGIKKYITDAGRSTIDDDPYDDPIGNLQRPELRRKIRDLKTRQSKKRQDKAQKTKMLKFHLRNKDGI